jgi:hypothetical protein
VSTAEIVIAYFVIGFLLAALIMRIENSMGVLNTAIITVFVWPLVVPLLILAMVLGWIGDLK